MCVVFLVRPIIVWAFLVTAPVVAVRGERRDSGMVFEFDSGAANHPEGFGALRVKVRGNRADFERRVRQQVTRYPPVTLSESEGKSLWDLIDAVDFSEQSETVHHKMPDEAVLRLSISGRAGTQTLNVRDDWNKKDDPIARLVRRLAELITKYTGEKAVLA